MQSFAHIALEVGNCSVWVIYSVLWCVVHSILQTR